MRYSSVLLLIAASAFSLPATSKQNAAAARVLRIEATAFSDQKRPTAARTVPHEGIVAADPAVLPLGTRIRVTGAGRYNGIYTVTDTGRKIDGREIDIFIPNEAEARRFGRKMVRVQVLDMGEGKRDARRKDIPAATARR
jgi:rare lipoprotein A